MTVTTGGNITSIIAYAAAIPTNFGTETVNGGPAFPPGTTLDLPSDGSASAAINALEAAAGSGALNVTTDAALAPTVASDLNLLLVESGNTVTAPVGYSVIADLSSSTAPTIFTNGALPNTILGGLSGMTVWDNSASETVYTGGGDSNVIGMSSTVMESLDVVLSGINDVVAVGVGDATVSGGGSSNIIWGSGTNTQSNLNVNLTSGQSSVMAGLGTNTIDLAGTADVLFAGGGTNNDTITGAGDIYVGGSGTASVTAGAGDVIFAGSNTMDATIGGTGAIFVGNSGNDTINASTGVTGWGGTGTMNFISTGNTTIVGASGATTAIQNSGTGDYFNNGAGVMTVSGGSSPATITETWAGKGGMLVNTGASGHDTVNMTEGTVTVVAGNTPNPYNPAGSASYNTVNFYGSASGNVWLGQGNTVDLASSGYVSVTDSTSGLAGGNNINAQNDTGTVNIAFTGYGDTITGGAGTNIFTPIAPPNNTMVPMPNLSFGTGTNELVLTPQNTAYRENLTIFNFNSSRDLIDFQGFGSSAMAQAAASAAQSGMMMPGGAPNSPFTQFSADNMLVNLYAGPVPSSQVSLSNIVPSHFIST